MYKSDYHIHIENLCGAGWKTPDPLPELLLSMKNQNMDSFGTSDHVNYHSWTAFLNKSKQRFERYKTDFFHFGMELTTISAYEEAYDRRYGSLDGYVHPGGDRPDDIALPLYREEIINCGVEYVIGAAHFPLNTPKILSSMINEFYRQQIYLARDKRIDIIGHPWGLLETYSDSNGNKIKFDNMESIPRSMQNELSAAIKENNKFVELNITKVFARTDCPERFKYQYMDYIREMFEAGVPVTIGSDVHGVNGYPDYHSLMEPYLLAAGFKASDFSSPNFR